MKTLKLISIAAVSVMLFTGCDFFRSIIGKPTSKEIERMKIEAQLQAKKQKEIDSLNKINEQIALEEASKATINEENGRFYVVLGSFKVVENANKMFTLLEKNGYKPITIKFKNGYEVVSVAGFNNYGQAKQELAKLLEYEYCPEDIWIYDIRQNLHE